ncbi:ATPase family AAA domain-containing protein 5 [Patella vulgata]|uniref:ATPase family AAA domain-containing protein 5 n=1 Tax=Patella vulgata TaxID=6465 RepID=UPI0024A86FF0|nr:ATPase family AAA domain-containing protein 5 [Patella vulgata]
MAGVTVLQKIENMEKTQKNPDHVEELQSPQRSITDFFKSPPSKQLNLMKVFSSTPIDKNANKASTVHSEVDDFNILAQDGNKIIKKKKKSNKVRSEKILRNENKDTGIENHGGNIKVPSEDLNKSGICRRLKSKKKKSKKSKDLDEDFIQHFDSIRVISDTSTDDVNSSKNENLTKKFQVDDVQSDIAEHTPTITRKHKLNEQKSGDILPDENFSVTKIKRKRLLDCEISEKQNKRSKCDLVEDVKKNIESISYEDYLKGLGNSNAEDQLTTDNQLCAKKEEEEISLNSIPKDYPSITKYFGTKSKIQNSNSPQSEGISRSPSPITITADIHPEPSSPPSKPAAGVYDLFTKKPKVSSKMHNSYCEKSVLLSPNSSCISLDRDEIILISSEIQPSDNVEMCKNSKMRNEKHAALCSPKTSEKDNTKSDSATVKETEKLDSSIEIISSPKLVKSVSKEGKAFLTSGSQLVIPSKTAQATLSFTKCGLKMDKKNTIKEKEVIIEEKEIVSTETLFVEKVKISSKKLKAKKNIEQVNEKPSFDDTTEDILSPRRSVRKKYKVTSLQFDDSKKTPIKIKIRCRRSIGNTSTEESEFTPRSKKTSSAKKDSAKKLSRKLLKAQELIVKAKLHKTKQKEKKVKRKPKKKEPIEEYVPNRRLSPRLATKPNISLEVIDLDEDVVEVKKVKAKKGKVLNNKHIIRRVQSPAKTKSPRKGTYGTSKLASIFSTKKNEGTEPEIVKEPEDPEKVRLRQAFLSSGIPDEIKKQTEVYPVVAVLPEFSPFPHISHVQQKTNSTAWNLPAVALTLTNQFDFSNSVVSWKELGLQKLYKENITTPIFDIKNFSHHKWLPDESCKRLLEDLRKFNSIYQFQQMFDTFKAKKLEELKSSNTDDNQEKSKSEDSRTEELIVIDEPSKAQKKNKLKRKKDKSKQEIEDTTKVLDSAPKMLPELMWTERYQPTHSSDIIGNTGNINRLKTWLLEWKHKTHKDARKMKKLLTKQSKTSKTSSQDDGWLKEDSDFYSEDSEDEEDTLCNTMLITGSHGIGKTATVYALAQELGYKVFEVNTSSSRNGKKILSRLQEATQSHQVGQVKDGIPPPVFTPTDNTVSATKKDTPQNKLPTAFTNLFNKAKKSSDVDTKNDVDGKNKLRNKTTQENDKTESKKRKRKNKTDTEDDKLSKKQKKGIKDEEDDHFKKMSQLYHKDDSNQAGGLNLNSTSVILFDEADLVFEKDVGFLSAVQYFMNTTKIPIILTTTNKNLATLIQARLEVVQFEPPSLSLVVSHLQTICLVEGIRTDYQDLHNLVTYYNNDVRRCMLALQFWVESGGGIKQHQTIKTTLSTNNKFPSSNSDTVVGCDESDNEDFVSIYQHKKRAGCRQIVDDESNDSSQDNLPVIHNLCIESVLGLSDKLQSNIEDHISTFLQGSFNSDSFVSTMYCCDVLGSLRFNLLINNIIHLLPLPKSCLIKHKTVVNKPVSKRKRILDTEDYDSEIFDSEITEIRHVQCHDNAQETDNCELESKKEKRYISKCLRSFSSYYENISFMDTIETVLSIKDLDNKTCSIPGNSQEASLSDLTTVYEHPHQWLRQQHCELLNDLETRCSKQLCEEIQDVYLSVQKKVHEDNFLNKLSLPVPKGVTSFSIQDKISKSSLKSQDAQDNIWANLPLSTSRRHVHLDYVPYVRSMHQTECTKQIEKAKRRFHHHFDNIGFGLKKTTLAYLQQPLE